MKRSILILLLILLLLVLVEGVLRLAGRQPLASFANSGAHSAMMQDDPRLGWRLRSNLKIETKRRDGKVVRLSTDAKGNRICPCKVSAKYQSRIVVIGGSFTNGGVYLDNPDTFSCQLQCQLPMVKIDNLGVQAFGTYQSLLRLESWLMQDSQVDLVLYGYVPFHQSRNIAHWGWHKALRKASSKNVKIPYITRGKHGSLVRKQPAPYPSLPLSHYLATVAVAEDALARWRSLPAESSMEPIALSLIKEMKSAAEKINAKFSLIYLHTFGDDKNEFLSLLKQEEVGYIDCDLPVDTKAKNHFVIPEDGHPNAAAHSFWSSCLRENLHGLIELP